MSSFKNIHMMRVFEGLARFFTTIITLDEMIGNNPAFSSAWASFKRMVRAVKLDVARYGTDDESLRRFEKMLLTVEGELLDGKTTYIYRSIIFNLITKLIT